LYDKPEDFVEIESNVTKRWIPENRVDFSNSFDENVTNEIHEQAHGLNEQSDQNAIDSMAEKLANLFISTAQKVGMCKKKRKIIKNHVNILTSLGFTLIMNVNLSVTST